MSWQDDAMIEQDAADALWDMGESEWRELMHEHHGWQRKYKELEKDARLTCEEDS